MVYRNSRDKESRIMGSIVNLVYYAAVARGNIVLAEHINPKENLADVGEECLEKVPPYHNQFTYTIKQRMFMFLIDGPFTYCAVVDEALGKGKSIWFLERVRDEFKLLIRSRCLDGMGLEKMSLAYDFAGVFNQLVKPLVGIPQKEVDLNYDCPDSRDGFVLSSSASARAENSHGGTNVGRPSLLTANGHRDYKAGKKHSKDQQVIQVKEIMMTNSGKALDTCNSSDMDPSVRRRMGRQMAAQMWWKNVKLVFILDLVVCCVLFAIWLGICGGFRCVN